MKKKIFILILLFIVSIGLVNAIKDCTDQDVKDALRKALYLHYTGEGSPLSQEKLMALLSAYRAGGDCTDLLDDINTAKNSAGRVPNCVDGTPYGKCSSTEPLYCYSGRLVPRCR